MQFLQLSFRENIVLTELQLFVVVKFAIKHFQKKCSFEKLKNELKTTHWEMFLSCLMVFKMSRNKKFSKPQNS